MAEHTLGREVIARLVRELGGVQPAATRLGVRPGLVERFIAGTAKVPDAVLLKALDLTADPAEPAPALRPASKPPKGRPVI